jgi:hypothetical protein
MTQPDDTQADAPDTTDHPPDVLDTEAPRVDGTETDAASESADPATTDDGPAEVYETNEALYWAATDAFLQRRSEKPSTDELDDVLTEVLALHVPDANEAQQAFHRHHALRYIMGAVASSGMGQDLPGEVLLWNIDKANPDALRPLRAVTGVLPTVLIAKTKDELAAIEQFALPLAEQLQLESTLQQHFGSSKDIISFCRFPFTLDDFTALDVDQLLTTNLVVGAEGGDDDHDQAFRQVLLRRRPVSRAWKLANGTYGYIALWPVTIISMLAADYWYHGTSHAEAQAKRISEILAQGLAERELLGARVDVYCGHIYVGEEIAKAVDGIETDLVVSGAKLQKLPVRRSQARIGRNLACPCGSGLKFKKCCGSR